MFITFEGCDFVGKSTQIALFTEYLKKDGLDVINVAEPGGSIISEYTLACMKDSTLDQLSIAMMLFASRRHLWINTILPAIQNNKIVLCDRFYDSTLVYQGILGGVNIEHLMQMKYIIMEDADPDITFILHCNINQLTKRISKRHSDDLDKIYSSKYINILDGYKKISETFKHRAVLINASKSKHLIHKEIVKQYNIMK